ncbi:hypothetical protein [Sulfuricurvum sp.]|uniref:hypothetical protein n=1 Tax=Sulfuricurvum sp. TaxID=2025608 RepID=UPI002D7901E5|nr:hypothetical protein [Sulfuricurvum sp.]
MGWFIVILILIITVSVLYGIIRIFKKSRLLFLITLLIIIVLSYLLSKWYEEKSKIDEQNFYLNHVPQEFGVSKIIYQNHNVNDGMGLPGETETGIVVFELPENTTKMMQSVGKDYFYIRTSNNSPRDEYIRNCGKWGESPIIDDSNQSWVLSNFLDRYGYGIKVDKNVEEELNLAVSQKGTYYTECRGGIVLIVAPKIKKVFYVYAG